ncbi:hypothetical protein BH20VER2_BH20VER2_05660 [soil metagenome]
MSISDLLSRLTLSQKDAEVIFDRAEPIGTPTDLVMPRVRRRWFRRAKVNGESAPHRDRPQSDTAPR